MALQMLLAVTIFSFALFGKGNPANVFNECPADFVHTPPEKALTVKSIDLDGCSEQPCTLVKGTNYVVNGLVIAHFTSPSLNYIVTALTPLGPLDILKGDISQYISPKKNFEPGMEVAVKVNQRIPLFVPAYKGALRISVLKPNDEAVYCAEYNVTIKEAPIDVLGIDLSDSLFG